VVIVKSDVTAVAAVKLNAVTAVGTAEETFGFVADS